MDLFKKHRAARIDHYVIEVNKLIIRLEKVFSNSQSELIQASLCLCDIVEIETGDSHTDNANCLFS